MGMSHLLFYKERGINTVTLAETVGIGYKKAWEYITGKQFISVDEYKTLVGKPADMEKYMQMKEDFELMHPRRVKLFENNSEMLYFYPRTLRVVLIDNSYNILWSANAYDEKQAIKIYESEYNQK